MNSDYISIFYEKYSKEVYIYVFSLCKDEQIAEDIVHEAFIKAILYLEDGNCNIKAWLFRVCKNLWIDYARKNKRVLSRDFNDFKMEDKSSDLLTKIIKNEEALALYKNIIKMPGSMREAIILYYYLDIKQDKIAELMNISNGAVRTLLYRARKLLKNMMEGLDEI